MSAESPIVDRRPAPAADAGPSTPEPTPADDAAGRWPEEVDIDYWADTSLTIPGQSPPPGECGTWGPREFCKCCGDVVLGPRRCQRRMCEECWLTWRGNRAAAITERLAGARRYADGAEKRLTHTVASPAVGSVRTLVEFYQAWQRAYQLAREKGVRGGVCIPHGWRVREDAEQLWRESREAGLLEDDIGVWRWIREQDRDWRELVYWSPHFHIIGVGADIGESDPEADDGWIFSRIDSFCRFNLSDPDTYEPMFRAASYLLSHLAYEPEEGKQSVRWFGELANNQFSLSNDLTDWEESIVRRNTEKVSGYSTDDGDGKRECEQDECQGGLAPIWSAAGWLADPQWCDDIGEQHRVVAAAFEWCIGDIMPPPGLLYPTTERDCKQAWGHVLDQCGIEP